jgi:5'-3' exonuclease
MIIIDLNQVCISNIMAQIGNHTNLKIEEDVVRHMVLNKIRTIRQRFKEYGDIVVACDGKNNWRRQVFPLYKAVRRADRENSDFDWPAIYDILNKIRDELKTFFPYVVIHLEGAEADDIIASLVKEYGVYLNSDSTEKIVIVSGDKDFVQLQRFANVEQYDPINNKMIVESNPEQFLKRHIIKGDRGDGVPNVLSDDDCFVTKKRQKKVTEKYIENFNENNLDEQIDHNYKRNKQLIDLTMIPQDIFQRTLCVLDAEKKTATLRKTKTFNYFVSMKLKNLMEHVGEF